MIYFQVFYLFLKINKFLRRKWMFADYENFIHLAKYANWNSGKNRRETFEESVDRYVNYFSNRFDSFPKDIIKDAILKKEVMPSMRAFKSAGKALDEHEVSAYNCSYLPIDDIRAFDEIMYILMCGTGVGFSVEHNHIKKLPNLPKNFESIEEIIVVDDSKIGWASAYNKLITFLYDGKIPVIDYSLIRPAGTKLKTTGGFASGPAPLKSLFEFTISTFFKSNTNKLNSLEIHDIVNKIAEIVVVGGVRRSALISLSDLNDELLRNAKMDKWYINHPHRALSNNSAVYLNKPEVDVFLHEWAALCKSKSGERGIFNLNSAKKQIAKTKRRKLEHHYGTNPCGEILLRPNSFCNLSEVVARPNDDIEELKRKVEIATIIGTFQSKLTNFKYIRDIWRQNCEEERLLGVSITGIMDNKLLNAKANRNTIKKVLNILRKHAIKINKQYAKLLGINPATAITTVKPSGTVSQYVNSASGIHTRYSKYYIRTVRSNSRDPLTKFLIDQGVPHEVDIIKPDDSIVFSFPIESPDNSVFRNDLTAIEQLEHYSIIREHWCEHNPSITVYVRENEWFSVGEWVYKNFDKVGGVSFLPYSDHIYKQAPYQEINEKEFIQWKNKFPKINWHALQNYEKEDTLSSIQELACVAGGCEI